MSDSANTFGSMKGIYKESYADGTMDGADSSYSQKLKSSALGNHKKGLKERKKKSKRFNKIMKQINKGE